MVEDNFIDAESGYRGGDNDKISFQLIVLWHVRKITQLCCVEWHGGYTQRRVKMVGGGGVSEEYYIQDSRACFNNAVNCLYDLVYPYFDKEMKSFDAEYQKEYAAAYELVKKKAEEQDKTAVEEWQGEKLTFHRRLFRALSCFLKRQDWFKGKELTD